MWFILQTLKFERDNMSPEEVKQEPTDAEYIEQDAYLFDSRNYFLKTVTFNMINTQQLSVAISRLQGLTNR